MSKTSWLQSPNLRLGIGVSGTILTLFAIYLTWNLHFYRSGLRAELQESAGNQVSQVEPKLRDRRNEMLFKGGMTVVAMLGVLGMLLNRLVLVRLKRLAAAASEWTEEREPLGFPELEGRDEIGQLAASFNLMAKSLGLHRRELQEKERMRSLLLKKIVRIQEEERKRISRDLHDHLGPSLSALLLSMQTDLSASGTSSEPVTGLISRMQQLIDDVHQMAWELRPSILDDYGLDSALRRYIDETSKHSRINIDYQSIYPPGQERIPSQIEITLYRVAQEAITNVVRHSGANRASVILIRRELEVMLLVEDDGCGFPLPLNGTGMKGLGLIGMQERVALFNGSCNIESADKCGTTVRIRIPLEEITNEDSYSTRRRSCDLPQRPACLAGESA